MFKAKRKKLRNTLIMLIVLMHISIQLFFFYKSTFLNIGVKILVSFVSCREVLEFRTSEFSCSFVKGKSVLRKTQVTMTNNGNIVRE